MNPTELEEGVEAAQELLMQKARRSFKTFVQVTKEDYIFEWFHVEIARKLQQFANGEIKKMMILVPPQHGKSELATRRLTPFIIGHKPTVKIAIASYSDTMVRSFNRDIQRIIDTETYHTIFPKVALSGSVYATDRGSFARNENEFEIVGTGGRVKTVGRGGALTGSTVDIGIIDDLYKDREEAMSMIVSESAWNWYIDVFKTRLHNDSQQLIMNTRWDEQDLAGRLIKQEGQDWEIIKFPAIRTKDMFSYDPRQVGEALYPAKHSLERLLEVKKNNKVTFNSLYQQDPKPNEDVLIFPDWIEIPDWPRIPDETGKLVYAPIKSWGLDFGQTSGINALIKHTIIGEDAYFEEELYEPGVASKFIAELLFKAGYNSDQPVYCDHMPTKIAELRRLGISAFPAIKGAGSVQAGTTKLKEYRCHYTRRSTNLKMELNHYQWTTYGQLITNIPVDDFNHACDACRYANYSTSFAQK